MAVILSGANGVYTRLGRIGAICNSILNAQGNGTLTAPSQSIGTFYTNILAQFTSGTAQAQLFDQFYNSIVVPYRSKAAQLPLLKAFAQALVIQQVQDDTPLKQGAYTLASAWAELIRQVCVNGGPGYFTGPTVSATTPTAVTGNTGTATASSSVTGPLLPGGVVGVTGAGAMTLPFIFPETVTLKCTADSFTGGATLYSEPFSVLGQAAKNTDRLTWDWNNVYGATATNGSGASTTLNVTDAALYAGAGAGGNLLQNGDFLHFSPANTPQNWSIVVGGAGAGTTILDGGSASGVIAGVSHSLQFVQDATPTLMCITQTFANAAGTGGTTSSLLPNTVYAGGWWLKAQAANVGNINLALVDGTGGNGAIINDNNAVANTVAVNMATLTTSYVFYPFFFRTPNVLPATGCKLRILFSGAQVNAKTINISNLAMRAVSPIYVGGPYVALFSGLTGAYLNDAYSCIFANDFGGLSLKHGFVAMMDMLMDIRVNGLAAMPLVGTTPIGDALLS